MFTPSILPTVTSFPGQCCVTTGENFWRSRVAGLVVHPGLQVRSLSRHFSMRFHGLVLECFWRWWRSTNLQSQGCAIGLGREIYSILVIQIAWIVKFAVNNPCKVFVDHAILKCTSLKPNMPMEWNAWASLTGVCQKVVGKSFIWNVRVFAHEGVQTTHFVHQFGPRLS